MENINSAEFILSHVVAAHKLTDAMLAVRDAGFLLGFNYRNVYAFGYAGGVWTAAAEICEGMYNKIAVRSIGRSKRRHYYEFKASEELPVIFPVSGRAENVSLSLVKAFSEVSQPMMISLAPGPLVFASRHVTCGLCELESQQVVMVTLLDERWDREEIDNLVVL